MKTIDDIMELMVGGTVIANHADLLREKFNVDVFNPDREQIISVLIENWDAQDLSKEDFIKELCDFARSIYPDEEDMASENFYKEFMETDNAREFYDAYQRCPEMLAELLKKDSNGNYIIQDGDFAETLIEIISECVECSDDEIPGKIRRKYLTFGA